MKKMKMGAINLDGTIGFAHIEDFDGQITRVALSPLKQVLKFLDNLEKMGFDSLEIGIKNDYPLFLFLDKERKTALAIAPRIEDKTK